MLLYALLATASAQTTTTPTTTITAPDTTPGGGPISGIPDFNAQYFRPSIDAQRAFWTDNTELAEAWLSPKLLIHYAEQPLIYDPSTIGNTAFIDGVAQADVLLGARFGRFRVGLDVPIYLVAEGVAAGSEFGLGDVAVDGKAVVVPETDGPVGFALSGRLQLPTATVDNPLGNPNPAWELAAIVDKRFLDDKALLAANVGYRGGPSVEVGSSAVLDDYLTWRTGTAYDFTDHLALSAELVGAYGLASNEDPELVLPVEAMFGAHFSTDDTTLHVGFGPGLTDGVGTPDWRAVIGLDFVGKSDPDTDGDGLSDSVDGCPSEPEDMDGVLDDDGCVDAPTTVNLVVVDDRGEPVDGAVVRLKPADGEPSEGTAHTLEPGAFTATVTAEDFDDAEMRFEVGPAEADKSLTVTMAPHVGTVKVKVVDGEGNPVDARILVRGEETEADGSAYEGAHRVGVIKVVARKKGFKTARVETTLAKDEVSELQLLMVPSKADLSGDRIEIKESVFFDSGKATIQERSFALLDEVAEILANNTVITKVGVEGHTDTRGAAASNKTLSQARADAVKDYLVGKGIDADRLQATGYGEERPLDEAQTAAAHEKNRRVDFVVLERDAK